MIVEIEYLKLEFGTFGPQNKPKNFIFNTESLGDKEKRVVKVIEDLARESGMVKKEDGKHKVDLKAFGVGLLQDISIENVTPILESVLSHNRQRKKETTPLKSKKNAKILVKIKYLKASGFNRSNVEEYELRVNISNNGFSKEEKDHIIKMIAEINNEKEQKIREKGSVLVIKNTIFMVRELTKEDVIPVIEEALKIKRIVERNSGMPKHCKKCIDKGSASRRGVQEKFKDFLLKSATDHIKMGILKGYPMNKAIQDFIYIYLFKDMVAVGMGRECHKRYRSTDPSMKALNLEYTVERMAKKINKQDIGIEVKVIGISEKDVKGTTKEGVMVQVIIPHLTDKDSGMRLHYFVTEKL